MSSIGIAIIASVAIVTLAVLVFKIWAVRKITKEWQKQNDKPRGSFWNL